MNFILSPLCPQDMDLLAENRSLIHTGTLLCKPHTSIGWGGWSEILVLLFDNYCESWGREAIVAWQRCFLTAMRYQW